MFADAHHEWTNALRLCKFSPKAQGVENMWAEAHSVDQYFGHRGVSEWVCLLCLCLCFDLLRLEWSNDYVRRCPPRVDQ